MTTAGIYVRISQDRAGAGLGVARQREDCVDACQRKDWQISDENYVDNDVSAYSGAPRPAWDRLIADVTAGHIDAIATWHIDRLTRMPRELEDVIDLADRLGVQLATATGEVDLGTSTGRMVARILGAAARHEAEHKAERQQREHRQRAEAGGFSGGGHRPFGYTRIYADTEGPARRVLRDEINEPEAVILRECAARALFGESLSSICRDLKERDVHTTAGNYFVVTTLRKLLCSARISGRREHIPTRTHRGKARPVVGEITALAGWPAIISPEHSDRLRLLLTRPDRLKGTAATGRTYLLSGILRCGICQTGLVGRPRSGVPRYVCPNTPGRDSCGRTATNAAKTDELIADAVMLRLSSPTFAERLRARPGVDPDLVSRISRAEERLSDLAADYAGEQISRLEWQAARGVLDRQLAQDRTALSRSTRTTALDDFTGSIEDMERRWRMKNVGQRQAIIAAVVERVIVNPANPRVRWDPDRFDPVWRT